MVKDASTLGTLLTPECTVIFVTLLCRYHLRDVVVGKIYFLLVRIKIKHMELSIIKREASGSGANMYNENETLVKHEIMDGAPVRGLLTLASSVCTFLPQGQLSSFPTHRGVHSYPIVFGCL